LLPLALRVTYITAFVIEPPDKVDRMYSVPLPATLTSDPSASQSLGGKVGSDLPVAGPSASTAIDACL